MGALTVKTSVTTLILSLLATMTFAGWSSSGPTGGAGVAGAVTGSRRLRTAEVLLSAAGGIAFTTRLSRVARSSRNRPPQWGQALSFFQAVYALMGAGDRA